MGVQWAHHLGVYPWYLAYYIPDLEKFPVLPSCGSLILRSPCLGMSKNHRWSTVGFSQSADCQLGPGVRLGLVLDPNLAPGPSWQSASCWHLGFNLLVQGSMGFQAPLHWQLRHDLDLILIPKITHPALHTWNSIGCNSWDCDSNPIVP